MEDILKTAFANNFDFDINDMLLLAILKSLNLYLKKNEDNFGNLMERLNLLEKNVKPRIFGTVG